MVDEVRSEATLLVLVRPKFPESSVSQTGMGLGIDEGNNDGCDDGANDGITLGLLLGSAVGEVDGIAVGEFEGLAEGVEDGGVVNFGSDGGFTPSLSEASPLCLSSGCSNVLKKDSFFPIS